MESMAIGGRKIKDLQVTDTLDDNDDIMVENSTPKTKRVKWGTVKEKIRDDLSESFSDLIVKETVHGVLMSNWFVIPDKENYSLAAVYTRRDDTLNYVQGIQRRSTGGYTVIVNDGTNGAEIDFHTVWVKNKENGSGTGEGETDRPVEPNGKLYVATQKITLSYANSACLRGYALFGDKVVSATATVEDQKSTPVTQTENVYVDVGFAGTETRVEVYAKGSGYVTGHVLDVHIIAVLERKEENAPGTGGDCDCPDGVITSDTLENLTGAYNATEHGLKTENTGLQNSTALQELIDTICNNGGGTIYIPKGEYAFAQTGDVAPWGGTSVRIKSNVNIVGDGASTVLLPTGTEDKCFNMFGGANTDWTYLENCRFENFIIDGKNQHCREYSTSGKGFALNLVKDCHWRNVEVRNMDATGFGMDCLINSSIVGCVAKNCGKAASVDSPGASGFGIGFGRSADEYAYIHNCTAIGNKRYGIFLEHQRRFWSQDTDYYPATYNRGFVITNCISQLNTWNYGCTQGIDVTYQGCISSGAVKFGYFLENSQQCNILNCISDSEGDTAYVIKAGIDPADNVAHPNKDNKIIGCVSKLSPHACKIVSVEPACEMTRNIVKDCYFNLAQTNTILMIGEMDNLILQGNVSNGAENISSAVIKDLIDAGNSWNTDTTLRIVSFVPEKQSPQVAGTSVRFNVQTEGGNGELQYRFYRVEIGNGALTVFRDWNASNKTYCNPKVGKYIVYAEVRDTAGSIVTAQTLFEWTSEAATE